jgi:8-oxo-dGTP pyrophosphatase MutT (NUDIX family)
MESAESLATKIDAITAVARSGLAWSKELYERERYERILELAAEMSEILTATSDYAPSVALATELKQGWLAQVTPGSSGYVTPKVSTAAACFDTDGRMLLGRRGDNGIWFHPTGWLEVGLTPAENVIKEVQEETGILCRPLRLIAVRDTRFHRARPIDPTKPNQIAVPNIALTFMCEALTSEFNLHPLETLAAGFFTEEETLQLVPERVQPLIQFCFAAWRGEQSETYFDYPHL